MYLGERWELVFVKDALTVRAYTTPRRCATRSITSSFRPNALWIF